MKTLKLVFIALFISGIGFTQNTSTTDLNVKSKLVGTWSHVSSSYPGGDIVTFQRDFQLFDDGSGICTDYQEGDTLSVGFNWEVQDSVIVLFLVDKRGNRMDTDAQFISLLDPGKMYLAEMVGTKETGKVCVYHRTTNIIAEY